MAGRLRWDIQNMNVSFYVMLAVKMKIQYISFPKFFPLIAMWSYCMLSYHFGPLCRTVALYWHNWAHHQRWTGEGALYKEIWALSLCIKRGTSYKAKEALFLGKNGHFWNIWKSGGAVPPPPHPWRAAFDYRYWSLSNWATYNYMQP